MLGLKSDISNGDMNGNIYFLHFDINFIFILFSISSI